jgi:RHS repeat-associated protein
MRYAGQYADDESGLYWVRARYYDPTTAQFINRDPIEAVTRSPYGYVNGDPLNGTDPSGLCFWLGCDIGRTSVGKAIVNTAAGVVNGITLGHGDAVFGALGQSDYYDKCSIFHSLGTEVGIGLDLGAAGRSFRMVEEVAADKAAYDFAARASKLDHVFDPKHDLDILVQQFGSREEAMRQMLSGIKGRTPASGKFEIHIDISGKAIGVRGAVVDGITKVGTAFSL